MSWPKCFLYVQLREWYTYKHKVSCKQLLQKKSIHDLTNDAKNSNVEMCFKVYAFEAEQNPPVETLHSSMQTDWNLICPCIL